MVIIPFFDIPKAESFIHDLIFQSRNIDFVIRIINFQQYNENSVLYDIAIIFTINGSKTQNQLQINLKRRAQLNPLEEFNENDINIYQNLIKRSREYFDYCECFVDGVKPIKIYGDDICSEESTLDKMAEFIHILDVEEFEKYMSFYYLDMAKMARQLKQDFPDDDM